MASYKPAYRQTVLGFLSYLTKNLRREVHYLSESPRVTELGSSQGTSYLPPTTYPYWLLMLKEKLQVEFSGCYLSKGTFGNQAAC